MSLGRDKGFKVIEYYDPEDEELEDARSLPSEMFHMLDDLEFEETTKDFGPFFTTTVPTYPQLLEWQAPTHQPLISTCWAGEMQPPWRCGRGIAIRMGENTRLFGVWYRKKPPLTDINEPEAWAGGLKIKTKKLRRWSKSRG